MKEQITIRLNKETIATLNNLARLNNSYLHLQLQRILDKYIEEEEREAYKRTFESAYEAHHYIKRIPFQDNPKDIDDEIPF